MRRGMVYTGRTMQEGSAAPGHVLDIALAAWGVAATTTAIGPPDFQATGAAAIGSLIGGLIAAVMFRDERVRLEVMWGVSFAIGVLFGPALFDWLSLPSVDPDGRLIAAAVIRRDARRLERSGGGVQLAPAGRPDA